MIMNVPLETLVPSCRLQPASLLFFDTNKEPRTKAVFAMVQGNMSILFLR